MKKLISFLILALISSQMWASFKIYVKYGANNSTTQGTIQVASGSSTASGGGYIQLSSSANCTFTATAKSGYVFKGWWKATSSTSTPGSAGQPVSDNTSYTVKLTGETYVYAYFAKDNVSTATTSFTAPTAVGTQSYTATPGANVRKAVGDVSIPPEAVDLGYNVLYRDRNAGASSSTASGNYYSWTEASKLNTHSTVLGGAGWRRPTQNEGSSGGLGACTTSFTSLGVTLTSTKPGFTGSSIFLPKTGYKQNESTIQESAGGFYWMDANSTTVRYILINTNNSSYNASKTTDSRYCTNFCNQYCIRPVYDINAVGVYKLTVLLVKDGATTANVYYCAKNQVVDITPATVSGYTSEWTSGVTGTTTGTKSFTVSSNTTATITYTVAKTYVTATFNNYNGDELAEYDDVESGTKPNYSGSTPTKPADANNVYTFIGWDPELGKITSNTTYTAQFRTDAVATFRNYDDTETLQSVQVEAGTQPSYTNATPTKPSTAQYEYAFTGWNTALNGSGNALGNISVNTTFYPQFNESTRTYTIRFFMEAGDETPIQTLQVAYNETPVCTASVTKPSDTYWTYEFYGWDGNNDGVADGVSAVTGDKDYVAVFTKTSTGVIPNHNVIIDSYSNGSVTLTANGQTEVVPTTGGTYPYEDGTTIIVKALPAKGYHFDQWNDAVTTANRQIEEISANVTLTPTFATNVPFNMYDTWTQADCLSNYNFNDYLTVTLVGRTFTAGQWATLSVPFDYTLTADDALYNAIYKFTNVTLSSGGSSVYLEFVRTNDIEKNEPYLVVPRQAGINEVVFDGVKLETPVQKTPTTDNRVAFVSTLWQQEISGPNDFYIGKLSTLYYAPTSGMTIKGNRAFFRKIGDAASAPRRAIIVIDGEETEVEIAGDTIEEVQDVRKYMENGILIIERNGVRMDAQGKRIN